MAKSTITKTWIAGFVVFAVGLLLGGINLGLMLAFGGHFVPAASGNGQDFIPKYDSTFWTTMGLMIGGVLIVVAGGCVQLAAWIGAVINTYPLQDKTWFIVLLAGGVLSLVFGLIGFATMLAYIIAGPDGSVMHPAHMAMPSQPMTIEPTG